MLANILDFCTNFVRKNVQRLAVAVRSLVNPNISNSSFTKGSGQNSGQNIICPNCKTSNNTSNMFCVKCGRPLHAATKPNAPSRSDASPDWAKQMDLPDGLDGIPLTDWVQFIGSPNFAAPIYISQFIKLTKTKFKFGFSLSAFLFGPMYFAYRKMWKWSFVAFALMVVSTVGSVMTILQAVNSPVLAMLPTASQNLLYSVVTVISSVGQAVMAVLAPYLYHRHALAAIQKLRKEYTDDSRYRYMLIQQGGTSIGGVFLILGLMLAYSTVLSFLFYNDFLTYWQNALAAQGGSLLVSLPLLLNSLNL